MSGDVHDLGLAGDGDEIAAIEDVEREFSVRLDYAGASEWTKVRDVYDALLAQLPSEEAERVDTWNRFARAIAAETGIPASKVSLESGLVAEDGMWVSVTNVPAGCWIVAAAFAIIALFWAVI